jgi:periplasmic protein TonB
MAQYLLQIQMMKAFRRKKQLIKTLDDIVFENRNKGYGCYDLRINYQRRLRFSFILVLFIFLLATAILYFWKINPLIENSNEIDNSYFETVHYNPEIIPMLIHLPDVPKEKSALIIVAKEASNMMDQQEMQNYKADLPQVKIIPMLTKADTSLNKLADILLKRHKDLLKDNTFLTDTIKLVLEKAPQFPGGNTAIQYYFYKNQQYPVNALMAGIHGSTIVSFVVNEKGIVEDPKIVSGLDPELDMEAIRLVKSMPLWQPAYYKGKPIACMLVIPVDFAIR